jgi:tryptophan-rich sensory protein
MHSRRRDAASSRCGSCNSCSISCGRRSFIAHRIELALADIVLLLAAILVFIALAARRGETVAALLMLPYAAWVAFATALNAAFFRLNA